MTRVQNLRERICQERRCQPTVFEWAQAPSPHPSSQTVMSVPQRVRTCPAPNKISQLPAQGLLHRSKVSEPQGAKGFLELWRGPWVDPSASPPRRYLRTMEPDQLELSLPASQTLLVKALPPKLPAPESWKQFAVG